MTRFAGTRWILASASPRRREILEGLGMKFEIHPSTLPEPGRMDDEDPAKYCIRVARLKSRGVGKDYRRGIIIGADTSVVRGNQIFGKPGSRADARRMLRELSGRWHQVITGVCLVDASRQRSWSTYCSTRVHFRRLSNDEIEWYLSVGEYADKAGAYAIQGYAALFVDRIEGCYFNIVGFPVSTFERLCRRLGTRLRYSL